LCAERVFAQWLKENFLRFPPCFLDFSHAKQLAFFRPGESIPDAEMKVGIYDCITSLSEIAVPHK